MHLQTSQIITNYLINIGNRYVRHHSQTVIVIVIVNMFDSCVDRYINPWVYYA